MRTALLISNNNKSKACRILDIPIKSKISMMHEKEDRPVVYPVTKTIAIIPEKEAEYEELEVFCPVYSRPTERETVGNCPRPWYKYASEGMTNIIKNMENVMFIRTV